jgi:hypothetical protein
MSTNLTWALDGQTTRRSKTLVPVGHGHVRWVLAEGWQQYCADGAADEAMVWLTADGAMGGCFVMVKACNFACKWVGILRYLFSSISATYSYRRNFDANHEITSFQLKTITKLLRCYFPDWITHLIGWYHCTSHRGSGRPKRGLQLCKVCLLVTCCSKNFYVLKKTTN